MSALPRPKSVKRLACSAVAAVLAAASLHAGAALVTSRAALGAADSLDWAQLGAESFSSLSEPAASTSTLGRLAAAENTGGDLYRFDQGGNWGGDFAPGAALLATFFESGPIVVDFAVGLSKVGAQIQAADFGSFSGVISVFDSLNNLLETYSVAGTSTGNGDDSAMFIGVSRATADIDRIEFSVTGTPNLDFAINYLSLDDAVVQPPGGVPEPASWALVAVSLAALGRTRMRRSKPVLGTRPMALAG